MLRLVLVAIVAVGALGASACTPPAATKPPPLAPEAYAHYVRGRAAFFEADYATALLELEEAAAAAPDEPGVAVARAEAMYRLGKRVDAGTQMELATARWPRSPEVWLAAGDIQRGIGELKRARSAYQRVLELDATQAAAYLGLAATETQAKRPAEAEKVYRKLIAALPEAVDGYEQLAQILLARGDDAGAVAHLRRVIELDGDRIDAQRALAGVHVRAGRMQEAIDLTRIAFDRTGGDIAIGADLVWLLLEIGDRRAALDVLDLYDASVPPTVLADAAGMYAALGELDSALAAAVIAHDRGRDTALVRARVLISMRRTREALAALDGIDEKRKAWPAAQAMAVEALLVAGRLGDARARADAGLAHAPAHAALVAAAAEAARRDGDAAAGRAMYRRAASTRPHDGELALAWAGFEARAGDLARSLAIAEEVLRATPDAPGAMNLVGFTLVELKRDLPRARRLLARARGLAPGDPSVLDSWGWLLRAERDLAGADRALTRAVLIAPHEPEILAHAAAVAAERGSHARARRLYALALARPAAPEVRIGIAAALAPGGAPRLPACYARVHMKAPVLVRVAIGSLLATAACSDTPSKGQCEQLLAHIVDLEATATGVKGTKDDVEKQKASVKEYAVGQKFIESCTRDTPKKVVACGLAAKNMDEIAACDGKK